MGNTIISTRNINFEDMQHVITEQNREYAKKTLIINTLDAHQQACLIAGTLNIEMEVDILNAQLKKNKDIQIVLYGMNSTDATCVKKYDQLFKLGFYNIYVYSGGLFEWLLLQDIYGTELFPTTAAKVDFLKYKGRRIMNTRMLEM
jgi:hypothetical protein